MRLLNLIFAMSPARGVLPTLRAATAPEDAARLWRVSEELTGVRYGRPADTTTAPVGG